MLNAVGRAVQMAGLLVLTLGRLYVRSGALVLYYMPARANHMLTAVGRAANLQVVALMLGRLYGWHAVCDHIDKPTATAQTPCQATANHTIG